MTMYITVATTRRIIQASDRRITWIKKGTPIKSDDDTNKAVIVFSRNARFSIVYSGIAEVAKVPLPRLVANIFLEINSVCDSPKVLFDRFIDELSTKFNKSKHLLGYAALRQTNISIAGFIRNSELFWLRISNHKDKDGNEIGIQNNFKYHVRLIDNPSYREKTKHVYVEIGGISDFDASKILNNEILMLSRSGFFHKVSGETITNKLVEIIRKFARSPKSHKLVGQNCMTTVLNAPPNNKHLFKYHDKGKNPVHYGPIFVYDDKVCFYNFSSTPNPSK